jgi:hypothetical protein
MMSHPEIRNVDFFVFRGHLMVEDRGLAEKLSRATFRELTDDELNQIAWTKRYEAKSAMRVPRCAVQINQPHQVIPWRDLDTFLTFKDLRERDDKEEVFRDFEQMMISEFRCHPGLVVSLAEFSAIVFNECWEQVPELRGHVAEFIRKCIKPPLLGTRYREVLRLEGDLVQLDRTGSYTSVYVNSMTPVGPPMLITRFDLGMPYYFIQIEVLRFRSKHEEDPFPMITATGIVYADKSWFECLLRHYDVEWKFVSGYWFSSTGNEVAWLAEKLWKLRMEAKMQGNDGLQLMIKRMLNSLWGKTLWKGKPITEEYVMNEDVKKYVDRCPLVYSTKRFGDQTRVRVIKPVYMPWQRPQFGVSILSQGRVVMQDLVSSDVKVYYCNTDSVLVDRKDVDWFPLGTELGKFHVEYEMRKFICLSPKKWLRVLNDGTVMNAFGRPSEEWFEEEYSGQRSPGIVEGNLRGVLEGAGGRGFTVFEGSNSSC